MFGLSSKLFIVFADSHSQDETETKKDETNFVSKCAVKDYCGMTGREYVSTFSGSDINVSHIIVV